MQAYLLDKPETLQQHLASNFTVVATLQEDANATRPPLVSPKGQLFAEQENLFQFDGQCFRETLPQAPALALFGVTSCDLTAIAYQDQFFAQDPYYQSRRQALLLVGSDCLSPCQHGFCPTVNAGPGVAIDNADLILHQLPADLLAHHAWLVLVCTDKGLQALAGLPLEDAGQDMLSLRDRQIQQCTEQFDDDTVLRGGIAALNDNAIRDELWQQLGTQCLGCSGCTQLCPTCSCYGTRDTATDATITRQRFWDSCLYEGFQREASGHNPSENAGSRIKRFWSHKFDSNVQQQFGRHGCVGCGRCEQTCPGVIGVHSVMTRIVNDASVCD